MKISARAIREFFPCNEKNIYVADKDYYIPDEMWFFEKLNIVHQAVLILCGLDQWTESNDCDNFHDTYHGLANMLYAKWSMPDKPQGIAVGKVWYKVGGTGGIGHAINVAFVKKNDSWNMRFIEPQGPQFKELTPEELSTIYFVRF